MQSSLTDLHFLLRSAQNCERWTFLDNLQTINQVGNMETRQMTQFFHFLTFIFVCENSQNSF